MCRTHLALNYVGVQGQKTLLSYRRESIEDLHLYGDYRLQFTIELFTVTKLQGNNRTFQFKKKNFQRISFVVVVILLIQL